MYKAGVSVPSHAAICAKSRLGRVWVASPQYYASTGPMVISFPSQQFPVTVREVMAFA